LIPYGSKKVLPAAALYGKNGGGKSNLLRAFWLGVQFVRNAQRTQHEKASIPVQPFLLNDYSQNEPTAFEFTYVQDGVKYIYGFSATRTKIVTEYLYHSPKGQKATIFERKGQEFSFPVDTEKKKKELISEAGRNKILSSGACRRVGRNKAFDGAGSGYRKNAVHRRHFNRGGDRKRFAPFACRVHCSSLPKPKEQQDRRSNRFYHT
jgi:hypothetical protein